MCFHIELRFVALEYTKKSITNMTLKRKGDSNLYSLNTLKQTFLDLDYLGAIPCTMFPWDALGIQSIPPRILSKRF